jgi:hypothetical protein
MKGVVVVRLPSFFSSTRCPAARSSARSRCGSPYPPWAPAAASTCRRRWHTSSGECVSYHVGQPPLLRQLAFRVCLPERRSEGFLPPKLHVPLHAGVLVQPLQREVPARGGASVGHHPASVAPSVFEHLVEQVVTFPEAYSPLIVL